MKRNLPASLLSFGLMEMGRIGEVAVRIVAANVQTLMGIPVDLLPPMSIPREALQQHRQQYDAGLILKHLAQLPFPHHFRILVLTTVDLCTPILTHVYGEAEMGGRVAVVSNFRLRCNEDGSAVAADCYYERLAKVSLHEAAHTLSVYHCEDTKCLMHFSPRIHHLDNVDISFCKRCEFILVESLHHLRAEARSIL